MADVLNVSVTPSCFWGSGLTHIARQCNYPAREGKAWVSEAQIFVITGGGSCSCCTLSLSQGHSVFAYLQHKIAQASANPEIVCCSTH